MHKVSVCIPAYNNVVGMKRLLDSAAMQSLKDYEVIITDDSDNMDIALLAEQYSALNIKYLKNSSRLGATANWNASLDRASGEYIKMMHHDDWFTFEDSLQKFVNMLDENRNADLAFSGSRQVARDAAYDRHISAEDYIMIAKDSRNLFLRNKIGAPSAMIYRNSAIRFDEKLTWLVDSEFYMRLLNENKNLEYTEEPLVSIGVGEGQLTQSCVNDEQRNLFEYSYIYEKFKLEGEKIYRNRLQEVYLRFGKRYDDILPRGTGRSAYCYKKIRKTLSDKKTKWKK